MQKAIEIQGASEIDVDFDKELKSLVQRGALLKNEGREVEKLLMNNNPDEDVYKRQHGKHTDQPEETSFPVFLRIWQP